MRFAVLFGSAIAATLTMSVTPAHAQDSGTERETLDVVVVTARQREESIQDIPVAVTAFTEDDFAKQGIRDLADIARFTSGFNFEDFGGGFGTPVVRSASQTRLTAIEANVSTFFDGIYVPRAWAINSGVAALQRVEVVKGPQSARYGRNSFMGAINFVPKAPTSEFEAEVSATFGSDERIDYGGSISGPIIEDKLSGLLTFNTSEFDGSWENNHPNAGLDFGNRGTSDNAGGWDNESFSAALSFTPIDQLAIDVAYYNFDLSDENRGAGQVAESSAALNCGNTNLFGLPRLFCGELPGPSDTIAVDPRAYGRQGEIDITKVKIAYDINDSLSASYLYGLIEGDVDIASISEQDQVNCGTLIPGDCRFQNTPLGGLDYDSHEFRLSYDAGGDTLWTLGVFVTDGQDETAFAAPGVPPLGTDPVPQAPVISDVGTDTDVIALFGEYSVRINEQWLFSAEARYSQEEKTQVNNANGDAFVGDFDNFTPRLTLEYGYADNRLLYASLANGIKSGGFNPTAVSPDDQIFDEETNWTFELGSKNTFLDGDLVLNATLFYIQWEDIQLNAADSAAVDPNAVNITLNLGDATSYGLEVDGSMQFNENLFGNFSFSYTDATYDDGTVDNRFARVGPAFFPVPAACDDVLCPSNGDISGNEVERQAPLQIAAGLEWNNSIASWNDVGFFARGDIAYQSEQEAESMNLAQIEARTIVNASAGFESDNWRVWLWSRNLTDERYVTNAFVVLIPFGNGYGNIFGERRTFGLSGTYRF
ncbi:MAG: TonB-dependent receptor [Pseudomonadota bacterium]